MKGESSIEAGVIVAHPDDETLWAGGFILSHPGWRWHIITLCRESDTDRNPKFFKVLQHYNADGKMGDMDDSPEQPPLEPADVHKTILSLLPQKRFNIIFTHSPAGEYTAHRRHEEVARGVIDLWANREILTDELLLFAYEDDGGRKIPAPIESADIQIDLSEKIWLSKKRIITQAYGFPENGFEAQAAGRIEAFWRFTQPQAAIQRFGK